jgi:hypothetical protein
MAPAVAGLPTQVADAAMSSIGFTQSPEIDRLGPIGVQLAQAARVAFVDGIGMALLIAAVALVAIAIVVAIRAPGAREVAEARLPETTPA